MQNTNHELDQESRQHLLNIAKQSVSHGLTQQRALPITLTDYSELLQQQRASFVTLHLNAQLRGCIGTLNAYQSLVEDISHNAYAAAFNDPRFAPVKQQELDLLSFHISVLSDSSPIRFESEQDLLSQIRPGIDGLIIEEQGQRGTFLPSVWEQLPEVDEFFYHLKQKAGLPGNYWSDSIHVSRYTVESFS